jgi:ATPase subunit of ABC transporter with duplicated ATPase domains
VAISHDRRFIERFANEIWEMRDGRLTRFLGDWTRYQDVMRDACCVIRDT